MRRYLEIKLSDGTTKYFYDVADEDPHHVARHTFDVKGGALVIYLLPPTSVDVFLDPHPLASWAPGLWDSCHARLDDKQDGKMA